MTMRTPMFTTDPMRIARLQENYKEGVERESISFHVREDLDLRALDVSEKKLHFLFQNAHESYGSDMKNAKVKQYNKMHGWK